MVEALNDPPVKKKDLRGTWPQALLTFFAPIMLVFLVRWIFFEPYVIPSGSMIPTLLVHDHILVNKLKFGLQLPFAERLWFSWRTPERGNILVFRFPENPGIFYIKRVIGLPGEEIELNKGQILVNGQPLAQTPEILLSNEFFEYLREDPGDHFVRYRRRESSQFDKIKVPEGHYFVLGDNRDESSDSRVWGFVPEKLLVGSPLFIWLSCEKTLNSMPFLCDPKALRWERIFQPVK